MKKFGIVLALVLCSAASSALADGLVINAAEVGIGKFHRMDNKQHPYAKDNAWSVFILPDGADLSQAPIVVPQPNGSITIFYSNLQELLTKMVELSNQAGKKISVFNMNAHGMPGGMWFPKDKAQRDSAVCGQWVSAAKGSDQSNYDQYYSPVSVAEIQQVHMIANLPFPVPNPCTATLSTWRSVVGSVSGIKTAFNTDAQIHFLSCTVGLGRVGKAFTTGIAQLLLSGSAGRVESSLKFGLGDWSMPEGMGFWDMIDAAQVERDNKKYPVDREDREIMQKGKMLIASVDNRGTGVGGVSDDRDFMFLDMRSASDSVPTSVVEAPIRIEDFVLPSSMRIPHTNVVFKLTN